MDPLLAKLQYKSPAPLTVVGAPPELKPVLDGWPNVRRRLGKNEQFVLAFVRSCAEIRERAPAVAAAVAGDGLLWMAYPKKSSKRYKSDVGRDDSWQPLGDLGFEAVRQVAIDEDWSALRFRRVEQIKTMARNPAGAISAEGKRRTEMGSFFAGLPEGRRESMQKVHEVVRRAAPELEAAVLDERSVGYGPFHYRYASGREGDTHVVTLVNQKQHVSLYISAAVDGQYLPEANASRLGRVSVGKSCIRFKNAEDVDLDVLADLVRAAADLGGAGAVG